MRCTRPQYYLNKIVHVPPTAADDAFDRMRSELPTRRDDPDRWTLRAGSWRLELSGSGIQERTAPGACLRRFRGTLKRRFAPGIPVELEFSVWSNDATEIGIRPRWSRWRSPVRGGRRYFSNARHALEILASEIESWAQTTDVAHAA